MRWWYHVIAALGGVSMAALIVFLVFGTASQQSTTEGPAPGGSSSNAAALSPGCGTINPASVLDAEVIRKARGSLPRVMAQGTTVKPTRGDQITWLAQVHAATGMCATSINVRSDSSIITIVFDADTTADVINSFTYSTLSRAFEAPLARRTVRVDIAIGSARRRAVVSHNAWSTFQRTRASLRLDPSIAGLSAAGRRFGFGGRELRLTGF